MEELGLPMAFGKQTAKPASLPPKPPPPTQTRGEPGQRGSRGVVGGSKRRRGGRGGHIPYNASGANAQPVSSRGSEGELSANTGTGHGDTDNAAAADGELNPGVKVSVDFSSWSSDITSLQPQSVPRVSCHGDQFLGALGVQSAHTMLAETDSGTSGHCYLCGSRVP